MLRIPFEGTFPRTQEFNDKRYRSSYTQFGLCGHNGWDYGCPVGTKLFAPHDGKVTEAALDSAGYGWYVKIENDNEFSVLGHMKETPQVKIGVEVKTGDLVGYSGNTGNSTGPHLHWGYGRYPRNRDNGFNGYIDQTHWMTLVDDSAKILALEKEVDELRDNRNKYRTLYNDLLDSSEKTEKDLKEHIESLQSSQSEMNLQLISANTQIKSLTDDKNLTTGKLEALETKFTGVSDELEKLGELLTKELTKNSELQIQIADLKAKIKLGLKAYTKFELFKALFGR